MKTLVLLALLAAVSFLTSACAPTPAYSGRERSRMIARHWNYEYRQMQDDLDHLLLLRTGGNLTIWNIQTGS